MSRSSRIRAGMIAAFAAILALPPRSVAQTAHQPTALERLIEGELARFPAVTGVYVHDLTTGEVAAVRADAVFNSASTRKIPIMILAFQLADQGKLDLSERVTLKRSDFRSGSGVLQYHDPGMTLTIRDLITQMIITSDNTATEMMLAKLGGPEVINRWNKDNGYGNTWTTWGNIEATTRKNFALLGPEFQALSREELMALDRCRGNNPLCAHYANLLTGPHAALLEKVKAGGARIAEETRKRRFDDPEYWTGSTTPREMGRLLTSIENGTAASKAATDAMRNIMLRQQAGDRRIPHFLNVPVAHKTGDLGDLANDVGIVYARSGPIVISFFAMGITGNYGEAEDRIGQISRLIVEYFDDVRR